MKSPWIMTATCIHKLADVNNVTVTYLWVGLKVSALGAFDLELSQVGL